MSTKQLIQIGVIVLIVIVFVAFATNIDKAIRNLFGGINDEVDHELTPLPPGTVSPGFDPLSYVSRLREVLSTWMVVSTSRCDVYKRLMELGDREFVMVTNAYLEETERSLRADMDAAWRSGCSWFATQWDNRVRDRMDELQVRG